MSESTLPGNRTSWRVRAYQAIVVLSSAAAIGVMATITLAGSHTPVYRMSGYFYEHGWPWQFAGRFTDESDRFRFWQAASEFNGWALAGDCVVLIAEIIVTILIARRAVKRPTMSLRYLLIASSILCIGCGYIAAHHHAALSERKWLESVDQGQLTFHTRYTGPVWLLRLFGDDRFLRTSFDRVTDAHLGISSRVFEGNELAKLPHLRRIYFDASYDDEKVAAILRAQKSWPIDFLAVREISGPCLLELERCPNLVYLKLADTRIGDEGMEYLQSCPRLQTLDINDATITAKSYPILARLQYLHTLSLDAPQISELDEAKFASLGLKDLWVNGHHYSSGVRADF
jgi:hypothetical protein